MADDEWSTQANEAITITFLRAGATGPIEIASLHPEYTEQQFDKEQSIFGFKDLEINLKFAAHDLFPNFSYQYAEKWKTVKDATAADIDAIFSRDLSPDSFGELSVFEQHLTLDKTPVEFTPPGQLVDSYSKDGRDYEVYAGELTNDDIRKIVERIQILVTFYIDGGIPIPIDDPEWSLARWRVWLVYEKMKNVPSPYSFVGYCTSYRFLPLQVQNSGQNGLSSMNDDFTNFEPVSITDLPNRSRISQFLILPHHQGQSHGRRLYESVANTFLSDPACIEITVEDPNEAFDDLRDFCDYSRLSSNGNFSQIKLNIDLDPKLTARRPGVNVPTGKLLDKKLLEQLRVKNKLAPRQFKRLVEMYLLSQIPRYTRDAGTARLTRKANSSDKGDKAYWYWRLLVKQRIYKQHKQLLDELEQDERIERLEETVNTQTADYERLLQKFESVDTGAATNHPAALSRRAKRAIIEDDDDDDNEDGVKSVESQASKRVKL